MVSQNNKIIKSVLLSNDAMELIAQNDIPNLSKFIDETLIEILQDKKFWKAKAVRAIEKARKYADKAGYELDAELKLMVSP